MPENRIITTLRSPEHPLFKHLFYLTWLKNIRDYVLIEEIIQARLIEFLKADKQKQLVLLMQTEQEYLQKQAEFNEIFFQKSMEQHITQETVLNTSALPVFAEILAKISVLNEKIDVVGQQMTVALSADTNRFAQLLEENEFKVQLESGDSIDSKAIARALRGIPIAPSIPHILRVLQPDKRQPTNLDQTRHLGNYTAVINQLTEHVAMVRESYGDHGVGSHILQMINATKKNKDFQKLYHEAHNPSKRDGMMGSLIQLYEERNAALGLLNQEQSKLDEVSDQYASPFSTNPFSTKPIKK